MKPKTAKTDSTTPSVNDLLRAALTNCICLSYKKHFEALGQVAAVNQGPRIDYLAQLVEGAEDPAFHLRR